MSTIAVQLTGTGRAAVATVLVDGRAAVAPVQKLFRNTTVTKSGFRANKTYFGEWEWRDYNEELVVCRTDQHRFEVHCHGGSSAPSAIIHSLVAAKVELVFPGVGTGSGSAIAGRISSKSNAKSLLLLPLL